MRLRLKATVMALFAAGTALATTLPITLTSTEGSGLKVEYDATADVYTLTAISSTQSRTARSAELTTPFSSDIRFLKFDYISTTSFSNIDMKLYKSGSNGSNTYERSATGTFIVSDSWQPYSFDARSMLRVTKFGTKAGQYNDFIFNGLTEGASIKIRNLRWASDEECYIYQPLDNNSEITVEAENFNQAIETVAHQSRQLDYPARPVYKNPTGDRLPIFAWCGPDFMGGLGIVDGLDMGAVKLQEQYRDMAECGFNCTLGTSYPGVDKAALFTNYCVNGSVPIHLLEGLDVKVIVKAGLDNEPQLAEEYRNSPYLAGYYIGDEPEFKHFPGMRNKLERLMEYDTEHMFYGNLHHIHTDMPAIGATSYENYVQEYVRQVGLGFLSFDYYPVRQMEDTGEIILMPDYFKNLEVAHKMAKYYDMPIWTFVHSVASACFIPNMIYPTPEEHHMRIQAFMGLAYASQGIQYFTYLTPSPYTDDHYHDGPLAFNGEKTPTWDMVRNINRDIIALNDVFLGAELIHAGYTHATTPEGCVRLTAEMLPEGVTAVTSDGSGVCVTLLQNGTKRYLMVVNPDISNSQEVTVGLSADVKQIKNDGSQVTVSGEQKNTLATGGHLIYLVDENAPVIEKPERSQAMERADYRNDADDVIIVKDDAASGGHFISDMGDRVWNVFSGIIADDANHVITEDDAIANWGAYYNYYVTVTDDMEISITVGHCVPWSEYGRVASTGATPGYSYIMEKNPSLNWTKAYAASMKLEIDGETVIPANQPLRPAVPEVFDPAGVEFNRILADKSLWVSTKNADNTPSDVLYFWPKEGGNDDIEFVYNETPDYQNVKLTAGEHKITVKSMSYPWHFDALKISSKQAGISAVGADESSEIVASQYFDLQGRQLSSAPEKGLYLRRDIRANGTATTVKIVR